jgi:septal ring factor EnvC (AmiA/AmiB activator)
MAKRKGPSSPLVDAAQGFADELETYAQLARTFVRSPLNSARQIERASDLLEEITTSEQRLSERGQALAAAVSAARDQQEAHATSMLEHLPTVRDRGVQLRDLLAGFEALGVEATDLNRAVAEIRAASGDDAAARTRALADRMLELAGRAETVSVTARDAAFEDLASQAHALHQQLLSACRKLQAATGP